MKTNTENYVTVQAQNCRNLGANVHPRLEVVVRVPTDEATVQPILTVADYGDLPALQNLLDT